MRESLERRGDIELDVIDVREAGLPAYDLPSPPALAQRQYVDDAHRDLGERLDAADAYLLITHEFNHGHSALLTSAGTSPSCVGVHASSAGERRRSGC